MGERQHPQTGVARSGPSHPGSGESEAGSGEGEAGASPGGRQRTPSSKSRFGGRGRKRGKKKALESGHLHCAASLSRRVGTRRCRLPASRGAGACSRVGAAFPSPPRRAAPLPPPPPCREALPRSPERRPAPRPSRRQTRLRRRQEREAGWPGEGEESEEKGSGKRRKEGHWESNRGRLRDVEGAGRGGRRWRRRGSIEAGESLQTSLDGVEASWTEI